MIVYDFGIFEPKPHNFYISVLKIWLWKIICRTKENKINQISYSVRQKIILTANYFVKNFENIHQNFQLLADFEKSCWVWETNLSQHLLVKPKPTLSRK